MSDKPLTNDPTNRIVCVFDNREAVDAAQRNIVEHGIAADRIRVSEGQDVAEHVDASAQWFADTDAEMEHIRQQLLAGNVLMSVPIEGEEAREAVYNILKRHQAFRITHFGQWVTKVMP